MPTNEEAMPAISKIIHLMGGDYKSFCGKTAQELKGDHGVTLCTTSHFPSAEALQAEFTRQALTANCPKCLEAYFSSLALNKQPEVDKEPERRKEAVDHPAHYGGKDNPYEAIKVIEAWQLGFNLGNCIKYVARAGKKSRHLEDLMKARWYLDREIKNLERK